MAARQSCPECGQPRAEDAPGGNCPQCLMKLASRGTVACTNLRSARTDQRAWSAEKVRLGDYELLEEAGRGGMGIVYRARQTSLNRIVAVKLLLFGPFATEEYRQRFRAEAAAAASLHHPALVGIHEIGESDGQAFFSMDYVDGRTLAQFVGDRPLPARTAATFVKHVAEAVHYAHQRGILHRDLKPSNILIDHCNHVRVTDFGLAKLLQSETGLTLTGATLGTPNYMPPEQLTARPGAVTTASDIYALGGVLYFCLTAQPPCSAETLGETLVQLLHHEPVRPRVLCPEIPRDLETICLKCLSKLPAARYGSAEALALDLDRWLAGEPIQARRTAAPERFWRWCQRKPALATLALALASTLVCGLAGISWQWHRAEARAAEASFATAEAREQAWRATITYARAERRRAEAGGRTAALNALAQAAQARSSPEARDEAIAALARPDLRFARTWTYDGPAEVPAYSCDLEKIAAPQSDGSIRLMRATDQRLLATLPATGGLASALAFSPDHRWLGVQSRNGSNVVWNLATTQPVFFWGPGEGTFCFTAGESHLLITHGLGSAELVDPLTGAVGWRVSNGHYLTKLQAQSQGRWFAGVREDGRNAEIRELACGALSRTLPLPSPAGCLAWSTDGDKLLVGMEDGTIQAWDAASGVSQPPWRAHTDNVVALGFSPDQRWMATESWDGSLKLWELPDLQLALAASGYAMPQLARFSSDSRWLGFLMEGGKCGVLEVTPSTICSRLHVPHGAERGAWSLDVSPNGHLVAIGHSEGFELLDGATGSPAVSLRVPSPRSVLFTPDGGGLLTCGESGIHFWPIEPSPAGRPLTLRVGPARPVEENRDFHFGSLSDDGRWIAAADPAAAGVALYSLDHPAQPLILTSHPRVSRVSISPDGHWAASGTWNGNGVCIWNLANQKLQRQLPVVGSATVLFSPDNRFLVTAAQRYEVWEVGTWRELYRGPEAWRPVGAQAFTPDARTLAVVGINGFVQLLKTSTGELLANLEAPLRVPISFLRFTPDGSRLFALEWTRSVQVWNLPRMHEELAGLRLDWDTGPAHNPR